MLRLHRGFEAVANGKLSAATFIEVVVTMVLLVLFAILIFPLYWGATHASTAHEVQMASDEVQLMLLEAIPEACLAVNPPYWESSEKIFDSNGKDWKIDYWDSVPDDYLDFRIVNSSTLSLVTPKSKLILAGIPNLELSWWKNSGRIIGIVVSWSYQNKSRSLHVPWGGQLL